MVFPKSRSRLTRGPKMFWGLPVELRRSLACTNVIENMNGTLRQVCHYVKRRQDAKMVLR
jgi:hypothetical protein